ncbi:MAG: beta-galactosidase [Aggregatilineales bacterium]
MFKFGCAWYPEHWPASRWPTDLQLMSDAGMNVVRVGEFAWSRMEPAENQFNFDWLEQAIKLAADYGMKVVLGTPTAAPPAWLTQQYPEILAIGQDGRQATHGMRCHYSPTSPVYKQFCRRISSEMAKCFGHNPHVIGWQIDNEFNSVSYDSETRRQFQEWLKKRFVTLASLAERWATAYWSEDYSNWSQIPLPVRGHNPGLMLAFQQFITDVYAEFQRVQIDAIRAYSVPEQWITHNFMKWFDLFDHYKLAADLDLVSWDNYVPTGHLDYLENGAMHDLMRGLKRKNFWLMETQPGQVNWGGVNTAFDRGETRTMAWHAIGHGADAILYWQWRSALGGQEQMHGTLVAPDGKTRPVYTEIAELGQELQKAQLYLDNAQLSAQIAVLHSYDDRWAINFQRHHRDFDPVVHLLNYYRPLRTLGHTIDIVHPLAPLSDYKLVVGPNLHITDEETAQQLLNYIQGGGHLVLGPRSGVKDEFNALLTTRQPGPLAQALGVHVEEYYALEHPIAIEGKLGEGTASIWAEQLQIDNHDAQVMLSYARSNGWLDKQPAMVTRTVGAGRITYIAAWLDAELMCQVTAWLIAASNIDTSWENLPAGVEVCSRIGGDGQLLHILINHTKQPQMVALPHPFINMLTELPCESSVSLPPLGIALLR